jgi:hypothetical protein
MRLPQLPADGSSRPRVYTTPVVLLVRAGSVLALLSPGGVVGVPHRCAGGGLLDVPSHCLLYRLFVVRVHVRGSACARDAHGALAVIHERSALLGLHVDEDVIDRRPLAAVARRRVPVLDLPARADLRGPESAVPGLLRTPPTARQTTVLTNSPTGLDSRPPGWWY